MAKTIHVLDDYYLAITALVTVGYQLCFFAIAFTMKFDKLTDFAGGSNFVLLAALTLGLSGAPTARQAVASALLMLWAARLAGFLLVRILRSGKDDRFDQMRDRFLPFLGFWCFQMLWVWTVSLPVTVLNSPAVGAYPQVGFGTARDIAGVVLYAVGLFFESVGDLQRLLFRERHRDDKAAVCDGGLFYVSRHPNYFGEIIIQFSIYMMAVSPAADGYVGGQAFKALYATIVGPVLLTLLLFFLSGLNLSERPTAKKRFEQGLDYEGYRRYLDRTSMLLPFPPQLYARLPTFVKRTLFLEFPMYVFDPAKHSDAAAARVKGTEEGRRSNSSESHARQNGHSADPLVNDGQ